LVDLRHCLKALPTDIPILKTSKYNFSNFEPDADWTAEIGEVGAVNREPQVRFGNRADGLKLVERGPETEAVVDVFKKWIQKYPSDIVLQKWVTDTLEGARRGLIRAAGKAVNQIYLSFWRN
ncbi:uncharacterized protein EDB91DRAFT_1050960, partial [Suillus paluster]|uniref:uncharacterized protein n=1 Tax=Suillus paluster TaxID=48578 RepID=UPI001B87B5AC